MREIDFDELFGMAVAARPMLERKAYSAEQDSVKIYLHWTAGWYENKYDDYHINIDDAGTLWASTNDLSETLAHTWLRNSGSIGIAMCCCAGATTTDLGECPPTAAQIESMAKCIAVLCRALGLEISIKTVMTHGEAADNDGDDYHSLSQLYGPKNGCERWDLEFLGTAESPEYNPYAQLGGRGGDVLRGKAVWYSQRGY